MKRPALALSAGILLLALMPGTALAIPAGDLDQSNTSVTAPNDTTSDLAQTFTAGKTGLLTSVQLYMNGSGTISVQLEETAGGLPTGFAVGYGSGTPTDSADWVSFSVFPPVPVTAGQTYAITFNTGETAAAWGSGDTYSAGQALMYSASAWGANSGEIQDFAFRTYVDPQTTTLQWDKTQLVAGLGTALTLTETFVFPTYEYAVKVVGPNALLLSLWSVTSDALPAWFTASGVTCSVQVATADCTLANVAPGASLPVAPDGDPIVLTLTGTASPALADVGTATGQAEGCVTYPEVGLNVVTPAQVVPSCVAGLANIAVVAPAASQTPAPTSTPPPTTTGGSGSSDVPNSAVLWPIGLVVTIGGALLLVNRGQRRFR